MNNPKYIIVHHSGGTDANPLQDSSNYTVEQCNQDHKIRFNFISTLGYYVGYQYFIDKNGVITQTRSDKEEGAHTIGKNKESLGICLAGNFDATLPTDAQINTLKLFIEKKMKEYLIPIENVVPHRTFATKTCYGKLLSDKWCQEIITPKEEIVIPKVEQVEPIIEPLPIVTKKSMFTKEQILSFTHTFIATFVTVFISAIMVVPADTLLSPNTWTTSFIAGIVLSAVRAGVKAVSALIVPQQ